MRSAISLDKIANDVCISLGDTHFNYKMVVVGHLIDCYRDFSLYIGSDKSVVTEKFEFGHTINLPDHFVYETKVGVKMNGRIAVLSLDKNQHLEAQSNDSETRSYLSEIWDGNTPNEMVAFYGPPAGLGELYGYGRGICNSGTYNINRKKGIIELGSHIPHGAEIYVEFMSDSVVQDGLQVIPVEAKKMHEYYALTEMYMGAKFSNITKSQINRNQYEMEFKRVKRLYNQRDPRVIIDAINSIFSPTNY